MNVSRGDLCRVVSNEYSVAHGMVDRFITVTTLVRNMRNQPSWHYEGPLFFSAYDGLEIECVPDSYLRRIDNPGDDAVDEMVLRVPVPMPEIIPAMLDRETV